MKFEKPLTALTAAVLAILIAAGALGCLVTALDLPVASPENVMLVVGGTALLAAVLLSMRWGNPVLACLMALAAGYLWQDGTLLEQTRVLLHRLTAVYSRAYGWGIVPLPPEIRETMVDWPLAVLGSLIAMTVCSSVCCRLSAVLPVAATVLTLSLCVVVTDTVPEETWLLMVMTGLALLILTAGVRRENPWQGLRLTALAAAPAALALTALFLAVPQEGYVNQAEDFRKTMIRTVEDLPRLAKTGINRMVDRFQAKAPEQVDLSALGERTAFEYPVMEVTAEKSGTIYLRERDYVAYDGLRWYSDADHTEVFGPAGGESTSLTLCTETQKAFFYLPYYPGEETLLTGGTAENPGRTREYTLLQSRLPEDWRQRAYQGTAENPAWQDYLALPETTRQEAEAYLEHLFSGGTSNTAKADIIAAFVLDSARYDLATKRMPEGEPDFALWFLREGETGYCVHFATAATVLLRAAGIPARYVTGYLLEGAAGIPVTVTEENAHAWAEYYEPNLGLWLPLEATPAQEEPEMTWPVSATEPRPAPTEEMPATEETVQETTPSAAVQTAPTPEISVQENTPAEPQEPARWPLLLLLPLFVAVQRPVRLAWRRRRFRRGDPNRQALGRWQEAERLSRILKECPPPELQELALKAKFSQYTLTGEEVSQFDEHIDELVRRMRKHPWWRQLLYRMVYAAY